MKTTRSFQFLCRLKAWQLYNGTWIRQQPIICFDREISVEEAKRLYPELPQSLGGWPAMPRGAIGRYVVSGALEAIEQQVRAFSAEKPDGELYIHTRYLDEAGNVVSQKCRPFIRYEVSAPLEVEVDPSLI